MYRPNYEPYGRELGGAEGGGGGGAYDDQVTYDVDHLATYTIAPHRGLSTPLDALTHLRRMAQTSGIWSRRLRLHIGQRDLVVVDEFEPVERFSLQLVGTPVCSSSLDGYQNVVAIAVGGDELLRRPGEIHLFQCIGRPGQDLVGDIMAAKIGIPRQRPKPPVYDEAHNPVLYAQPQRPPYTPVVSGMQQVPSTPTFDSTSTTSHQDLSPEAILRISMKVLNLCFDEIEHFVSKLQQAAMDVKNQAKPNAECAKAPEAKDFYNIFQKIKLCFILLYRLKNVIYKPKASELVDLIFTPLSVIVEACRPTADDPPLLGSRVVSPLLTTGAVELLNNCLTSKQMETWRSLGDAWNTPRNKWTKDIPKFTLAFSNGRLPPQPWLDHVLTDDSTAQTNGHSNAQGQNPNYMHMGSYSVSSDDIEEAARQNREFLDELQTRKAAICRVTRRRDANNSKELTVEVNDIVEVLEDTKNWWKVRNYRSEIGYIPNSIVTRVNNR